MVVPQGTILYETSSFLHIGSNILRVIPFINGCVAQKQNRRNAEKWLVVNYDILQ